MKYVYPIIVFLCIAQHHAFAQSTSDFSPTQTIRVTDKSVDQNAVINPYPDHNSLVIIENSGENNLIIKIQNKEGKTTKSIPLDIGNTKELRLLLGFKLYLESTLPSEAKVKFKKLKSY
ncbi:hypothetical protein [Psychroserpens algicola]|uniref:hypothetical protein n=1 Tax=Psychroserpens algicola TaxID=1719034 RepID=UPI0019538477|nr:hypothetical protein [Psychroserpens algicola]